MEWSKFRKGVETRLRTTVFFLFFIVLTIFVFDQWIDLENIKGLGFSGLTEALHMLGTQTEMLFSGGIILGILAILFVKNRDEEPPLSLFQSRKDQNERVHMKKNGAVIFLLVIGFIISRIAMMSVYDGSYMDEYWHVFSGQQFLEDGTFASFTEDGRDYEHGRLLSLLVGLSISLFGTHVWAVKLIPVLISVANILLLVVIGYHVFRSSNSIILLLLLYTFSPWLVFQHFYAQMFVFYEFLTLLLLVVAFRVIAALQAQKLRRALVWGVLLLILPLGVHIFFESVGTLMLLLLGGVLVVYIVLFGIQYRFIVRKKRDPHNEQYVNNPFPRLLLLYKILFILIFSTVVFLLFRLGEKVRYFSEKSSIYNVNEGSSYIEFFFEVHPIFTLFFLLSFLVLMLPSRERIFATVTLVSGFLLFLLYLASVPEVHMIRGVLYLMPLFFLVTLLTIERFHKHTLIALGAPLLLLLNVLGSYPEQFFDGPYVPGEVSYMEYQKAFSYVNEECTDTSILHTSAMPFIGKFYEVKTDYAINTTDTYQSNPLYTKATSSEVDMSSVTYYEKIPVVTERRKLSELTRESYCYIEEKPSVSDHISRTDRQLLTENTEKRVFRNITVFVNTNE